MATKKKKVARRSRKASPASAAIEKGRFWLMYPPKMIKTPILWELGQKFNLVTNVRQASVTDEIGILCLEFDGPRSEIDAAVAWLEKSGINVEPVEINVIES
jgi:L-aspartate semialdehyde sulfurtransferase ferredoxin